MVHDCVMTCLNICRERMREFKRPQYVHYTDKDGGGYEFFSINIMHFPSFFPFNVYIVYLVMGYFLYRVCLLIHRTRLVIPNTPNVVRTHYTTSRSTWLRLKPGSQPHARFFDRTIFSLIPIFWNRIRFY